MASGKSFPPVQHQVYISLWRPWIMAVQTTFTFAKYRTMNIFA